VAVLVVAVNVNDVALQSVLLRLAAVISGAVILNVTVLGDEEFDNVASEFIDAVN
jgi:hypothetical protein